MSVLQKIPQMRDSPINAESPKNENARMEVFTALLAGGGEALPIFSYEQEAELFLGLQAAGSGWRVRESTAGELISMLCGPCASATEVSLDPLPEMFAEGTLRLVNLSRKRFVSLVLARGQRPTTGG